MDNEEFKMPEGEDVVDTDLREVLLSLSEKGEIKYTDKYKGVKFSTIVITQQLTSIAKPYRENISKLVTFYNPNDTLTKIKKDYDRKKLDVANEFISENLISKFSELMKSLELVDDSKSMDEELTGNQMLKKDLKNIVGNITPYLPYIGLICGGVVVAKHVINKKYNGKQEQQDENKQGN